MTLQVTNTRIIIENALGQEKFDSSHKLIHKRFTYANNTATTIGVGSGVTTMSQQFELDYYMKPQDLAVVYVTLTSASGTVSSTITNSEIQLNFPMLADFQHSTSSAVITRYDVLTACVFGSDFWGQKTNIKFTYFGHYMGPFSSADDPFRGRVHRRYPDAAVSFTFKVVIYAYQ